MRILTTDEYDRWIGRLRDRQGRYRINRYFQRIQAGGALVGDFKMVRPRIIEVRFDFGHGYRVYLTQEGEEILLLLVGGNKSSQDKDIDKAVEIARRWREERDEDARV